MAKAAAAWSEASAERATAGRQVGPYRIVRQIGAGGMGVVYLAVRSDDQYEKQVAIKLVRPGLDHTELLERFRRERQVLANLEHPNIARLLDGGVTESGLPYLVMDYVDGPPITEYCEHRQLSIDQRLKLFCRVCSAVHYAHQNLVVHRDLKPSNILVTAEGVPKLLDFGIAKLLKADSSVEGPTLTVTKQQIMTPEYASPEQVRGETITTATDVYSLGVLLYELLTGQRPYQFETASPLELAKAVCEDEPAKPSANARVPEPARRAVAGDLDNIVLMALRKEPQRRYASAEQFSNDVLRYLEGQPVMAHEDSWRYRAGKFLLRHKAGAAATALVMLALLAGVTGIAWEAGIARREAERAKQEFNDVRQLANSFLFDVDGAIRNLPGSIPARQLVVKKALEYLDKLGKQAAGDASLQTEIVEAYLKVGDIQGDPYAPNLGDTAGALANYRKALALAQAMMRMEPRNPNAQRCLGRAYGKVAVMVGVRGHPAEAVTGLAKAIAILEPLAASHPRDARIVKEVGSWYNSMGDMQGNRSFPNLGETAAALESYRKALAADNRWARVDPADKWPRESVAIDYAKISDMLVQQGRLAQAEDGFRKSLAILEDLSAREPANARLRRDTGSLYTRLGDLLATAGRTGEALAVDRKALAIDESIQAAAPNDSNARLDVAVVYKNIGDADAAMGHTAAAVSSYRKVLDIIEALAGADPANALLQSHLLEILTELSGLLDKTGQSGEARQMRARGLALLKRQADRPQATPGDLGTYARALLERGIDARSTAQALDYARKAVEATQSRNATELDTLAQAYFIAGQRAAAIETERKALALLPAFKPGESAREDRREFEDNLKKFAASTK